MVRLTSRQKYTGISMPKELMNEIDRVLKEKPELQYTSRAEYIKTALREKLERDQRPEALDFAYYSKLTEEEEKTKKELFKILNKLMILEKKVDNISKTGNAEYKDIKKVLDKTKKVKKKKYNSKIN